jgi:hypothetical protein
MHGRDEKLLLWKTLRGGDYMLDLGIDGKQYYVVPVFLKI